MHPAHALRSDGTNNIDIEIFHRSHRKRFTLIARIGQHVGDTKRKIDTRTLKLIFWIALYTKTRGNEMITRGKIIVLFLLLVDSEREILAQNGRKTRTKE